MEYIPATFSGIVGIVMFVLAIAISIYWLLFPWFVYHKFDRVIDALGDQNKLLNQTISALENLKLTTTPKPALPPLPGKERYFVAFGENIGGPHNCETIEGLVERGTIAPQAVFVIQEGGTQWKRFDEVFELRPEKERIQPAEEKTEHKGS